MLRIKLFVILLLLAIASYGTNARAQNTQFLNSPAVTCAATATPLVSYRARNAVTIAPPSGGSTVYIGSNANVTASGANVGFPVVAGGALTLQPYDGPLWCVVSSGTQSTNVVESY